MSDNKNKKDPFKLCSSIVASNATAVSFAAMAALIAGCNSDTSVRPINNKSQLGTSRATEEAPKTGGNGNNTGKTATTTDRSSDDTSSSSTAQKKCTEPDGSIGFKVRFDGTGGYVDLSNQTTFNADTDPLMPAKFEIAPVLPSDSKAKFDHFYVSAADGSTNEGASTSNPYRVEFAPYNSKTGSKTTSLSVSVWTDEGKCNIRSGDINVKGGDCKAGLNECNIKKYADAAGPLLDIGKALLK